MQGIVPGWLMNAASCPKDRSRFAVQLATFDRNSERQIYEASKNFECDAPVRVRLRPDSRLNAGPASDWQMQLRDSRL